MRVLVIEDDPAVRNMLELVLALEGFDVAMAGDGAQGLAAARAHPPDVIVLDVMMPDINGWDVAALLSEDPDLGQVPVVFCTAMSEDDATWRGWQLGAASYVPKPFDTDQLVGEVLRVAAEAREITC